MRRSQKRLLQLAVGLLATLLASACLYMWGMSALEGHPRGFWDSLEWAAGVPVVHREPSDGGLQAARG